MSSLKEPDNDTLAHLSHTDDQQRLRLANTNVQYSNSFLYSHTQNIELNQRSCQKLVVIRFWIDA